MKLNIEKTSSKRGLLKKTEVHTAIITVAFDEEEQAAIATFVDPKKPETNMSLMTYSTTLAKGSEFYIWYRNIAEQVAQSGTFVQKFHDTTPIARETLVNEFIDGLKHFKDIVLANAIASEEGTSEIEI